MTNTFTRLRDSKVAYLVGLALVLPACATNSGAGYTPLVDGPKDASFHADLGDCQSLAKDRSRFNGDTQNDAMLGAAAGGLVGAIEADSDHTLEGIIAGAVVGSVFGAAESVYDTRDERRDIVVQCMSGRGHKVVG